MASPQAIASIHRPRGEVRRPHHARGQLTELSEFEMRLTSPVALAVLSNLKITVAATPRGNPAGEIYGKVVDAGGTPSLGRLRFTSTTPQAEGVDDGLEFGSSLVIVTPEVPAAASDREMLAQERYS